MDQRIVGEYVAYEAIHRLGILTPRTRLADVIYRGREENEVNGFALFLEHGKDMAKRRGGWLVDTGNDKADVSQWLERASIENRVGVYLAEMMVGNDSENYSATTNHNLKFVQHPDGSIEVVPHDFNEAVIAAWKDDSFDYDASRRIIEHDLEMLFFSEDNCENPLLKGLDKKNLRNALKRVATSLLARREEVSNVLDHEALGPRRRQIIETRFNAFFDALEHAL